MGQYQVVKVDAHVQVWAWRKDYIDGVINGAKGTYDEDKGAFLSIIENNGNYSFVAAELSGLTIPEGSVPIEVINNTVSNIESVPVVITMTQLQTWHNTNRGDLYGNSEVKYGIDDSYRVVSVGGRDYIVPYIDTPNMINMPIRIRYVYKLTFNHTDDETHRYSTVPQTFSYETVLNCDGNYKLIDSIKPYYESSLTMYDKDGNIIVDNVVTSVPYYLRLIMSITGVGTSSPIGRSGDPDNSVRPFLYRTVGSQYELEHEPMSANDINMDETASSIGVNTEWTRKDADYCTLTDTTNNAMINPKNSWVTERLYRVESLTSNTDNTIWAAKMVDPSTAINYPLRLNNGSPLTITATQQVAIPYVERTASTSDYYVSINVWNCYL